MIKDHPVLSVAVAFFFAWGLTGASPLSTLADFHNSILENGGISASAILAQAQTGTTNSSSNSNAFGTCPDLTLNLSADNSGAQVTRLQEFLKGTTINGVLVYPQGLVTGFFGPLTEQAVQKLQSLAGIVSSGEPDTTGYGYVGPRTRAFIAENCGRTGEILTTETNPPDFTTNNNGSQTNSPDSSGTETETTSTETSASSKPDYVITAINFESLGLEVTIKNQGGNQGNGSVTVTASPKNTTVTLPTYRVTTGAISPGLSVRRMLIPSTTITVPNGVFDYELFVDSNNSISELNESNNKRNTRFDINNRNIAFTGTTESRPSSLTAKTANDCDFPVPTERIVGIRPINNSAVPFLGFFLSGGNNDKIEFDQNGMTLTLAQTKATFMPNGSEIIFKDTATPKGNTAYQCFSSSTLIPQPLYEYKIQSCTNGVLGTATQYATLPRDSKGNLLPIPAVLPREIVDAPGIASLGSSKFWKTKFTDPANQKFVNVDTRLCGPDEGHTSIVKITPVSPATKIWTSQRIEFNNIGSQIKPNKDFYDFGCYEPGETAQVTYEIIEIPSPVFPPGTTRPIPTFEKFDPAKAIYDAQLAQYDEEGQKKLKDMYGEVNPALYEKNLAKITASPSSGNKVNLSIVMPIEKPLSFGLNTLTGWIPQSIHLWTPGERNKILDTINRIQTPSVVNGALREKDPGGEGDEAYFTWVPLPRLATNKCAVEEEIVIGINRGEDARISVISTPGINGEITNRELRKRSGVTVNWKLGTGLSQTRSASGILQTGNTSASIIPLPADRDWVKLENQTGDQNYFVIDGLKTRSTSVDSTNFILYTWDEVGKEPVRHPVRIYFKNSATPAQGDLTTDQYQRGVQQYANNIFLLPIFLEASSNAGNHGYTHHLMSNPPPTSSLRNNRTFFDSQEFMTGFEPASAFIYSKRYTGAFGAEAQTLSSERARVALLPIGQMLNGLPSVFNEKYGSINFTRFGKYEFVARTYAQESLKSFAELNFALPTVSLLDQRVTEFMNAATPQILKIQVMTGNNNTAQLRNVTGTTPARYEYNFKAMTSLTQKSSYKLDQDTIDYFNVRKYNGSPNSITGTQCTTLAPNGLCAGIITGDAWYQWTLNNINNSSVPTWNKVGGTPSGANTAPIDSSFIEGIGGAGGETNSGGDASGSTTNAFNVFIEEVRAKLFNDVPSGSSVLTNFNSCQYAQAVYPRYFGDTIRNTTYNSGNCKPETLGGNWDKYPLKRIAEVFGIPFALGETHTLARPTYGFRFNLITGEVTYDPNKSDVLTKEKTFNAGINSPISLGTIPNRALGKVQYDQFIELMRNSTSRAGYQYLLTNPDTENPSGLPLYESFVSKFAEKGPNDPEVQNQINSFPWIQHPWLQYWFFGNLPNSGDGHNWLGLQRRIDVGIIAPQDVKNHILLGRTTVQQISIFERWVYNYLRNGAVRSFLVNDMPQADREVVNEIIRRLGTYGDVPLGGSIPNETGTGPTDLRVINARYSPNPLTSGQTLQFIQADVINTGVTPSNGGGFNTLRAVPIDNSSLPTFETTNANSQIVTLSSLNPSFQFPNGNHRYRITLTPPSGVDSNTGNNTLDFTINVGVGSGTTSSLPTVTVSTNKSVYTVGETIQVTVVVQNNSNTTITIGNCPSIIGFSFWQQGVVASMAPVPPCTSPATDIIGPLSSKTYTTSRPTTSGFFVPTTGSLISPIIDITATSNLVSGGVVGASFSGQKSVSLQPSTGGTTSIKAPKIIVKRVGTNFETSSAPSGSIRVNSSSQTGTIYTYTESGNALIASISVTDSADHRERAAICNFPNGGTECTLTNISSYALPLNCDGSWCTYQTAIQTGQTTKIVFLYDVDVVGVFSRVMSDNLIQQQYFRDALRNVGFNRSNSAFAPFRDQLYSGNPNGFAVFKAWREAWMNLSPGAKTVAPYDANKHQQVCVEYKRIFTEERTYYNSVGQLSEASKVPDPNDPALLCPMLISSNTTPSTGVVSANIITASSLANVKLFDYDFWKSRGWSQWVSTTEVNNLVDRWNRIVDQIPYGGPEVPGHIAKAANQTPENGGAVIFRKFSRVEAPVYPDVKIFPYYIHGLSSQLNDIFNNTNSLNVQGMSGGTISNSSNPFSASNAAMSAATNVAAATSVSTFATLFPATFTAVTGATASQLSALGIVCATGVCFTPYTFIPAVVIAIISSINGKPTVGPNYNIDINISGGRASVGSGRADNGGDISSGTPIATAVAKIINEVATTKNVTLNSGRAGVIGYFPKRGGFFINTENVSDGTKEKYFVAPEYAAVVFAIEVFKKNNIDLSGSEIDAIYIKTRNDFNEFRKYLKSAHTYEDIDRLLTVPDSI